MAKKLLKKNKIIREDLESFRKQAGYTEKAFASACKSLSNSYFYKLKMLDKIKKVCG